MREYYDENLTKVHSNGKYTKCAISTSEKNAVNNSSFSMCRFYETFKPKSLIGVTFQGCTFDTLWVPRQVGEIEGDVSTLFDCGHYVGRIYRPMEECKKTYAKLRSVNKLETAVEHLPAFKHAHPKLVHLVDVSDPNDRTVYEKAGDWPCLPEKLRSAGEVYPSVTSLCLNHVWRVDSSLRKYFPNMKKIGFGCELRDPEAYDLSFLDSKIALYLTEQSAAVLTKTATSFSNLDLYLRILPANLTTSKVIERLLEGNIKEIHVTGVLKEKVYPLLESGAKLFVGGKQRHLISTQLNHLGFEFYFTNFKREHYLWQMMG